MRNGRDSSFGAVKSRKFPDAVLLTTMLGALLVRVIFIGYLQIVPPAIRIDSLHYQQIGLNLATGAGFSCGSGMPTALASPGQPLFLALVFLVFGYSVTAALIFQALLSAITATLVVILFRLLFPDLKHWSMIIGLLAVFHPHLIYYCGVTMSETLFTFLIVLLMVVLEESRHRHAHGYLILAGILTGAGLMTRANLIAFIPVIGIWILLFFRVSWSVKFTKLLLFGSAIFLTILPWIVRNYVMYDAFIPLTTRGAHSFFTRGFNPFSDREKKQMLENITLARLRCEQRYLGGEPPLSAFQSFLSFAPRNLAQWYPEPYRSQFSQLGEVKAAELYMALVRKSVAEHPARAVKLFLSNMVHFWDLFGDPLPDRRRLNAYWLFLLPFLIVGVILSRNRWRELFLVYGLVLSFFALFTIAGAETRYRIPLEPIIFIFAPVCWDWLRERLSAVRSSIIIVGWAVLVFIVRFSDDAVRSLLKSIFFS